MVYNGWTSHRMEAVNFLSFLSERCRARSLGLGGQRELNVQADSTAHLLWTRWTVFLTFVRLNIKHGS